LREVLALDVETGALIWKVTLSNRAQAGKNAGCVEKRFGYVLVRIDGALYAAHDLIWLMLYGEWCPGRIDHKDRKSGNNKPSNLRLCTQQQNLRNKGMQSNNTSGYRGVYREKSSGWWIAQYETRCGSQRICYVLGKFNAREEAAEVARQARLKAFGEFAPDYDRLAVAAVT
jgi:hypothetical protein